MDQNFDELASLDRKPEVFAPPGSFEAKVKELTPGPYYAAVEEVLPTLQEPEELTDAKAPSADLNFSVDRRDFMRLFGATAALGATSCVRMPAEQAIPYVNQPIESIPGVPVHYASTCGECSSGCGIVVRTREGRPTKLEGSPEHMLTQGGLCTVGQASIQGLYHPERLSGPQIRYGKRYDFVSWDKVYPAVADKLSSASKVAIICSGSTGSRHGFYREVLKALGSDPRHLYVFEQNPVVVSSSKAHELAFGHYDMPRIDFEACKLVVGIGTDFLSTGAHSVYHSKGFSKGMSFHRGEKGRFVQFESALSHTGAKADQRHIIEPGQEFTVALALVRALHRHRLSKGSAEARQRIAAVLSLYASGIDERLQAMGLSAHVFDELAEDLVTKSAVVVAGSSANDDAFATRLQLVTVFANILVGAYGAALRYDEGWALATAPAGEMQRFVNDADSLDAVIVIDANPMFATAATWGVKEKLEKIQTVISCQPFPNEVDLIAKFVLPANHYLESWGDEQPIAGLWSLRQPAVRATTDSRQTEDALLWILAHMGKSLPFADYRAYLSKAWSALHAISGSGEKRERFEQQILQVGFFKQIARRAVSDLREVRSHFDGKLPAPLASGEMWVLTPIDARMMDGRTAHLPVLQELGDSLTTISWDSWAALNPHTAAKLGMNRNHLIRLTSSAGAIEVPIYPLPGVHPNVVVVPRGNGHRDTRSKISFDIGLDPLPLVALEVDPLSGQFASSGMRVKMDVLPKEQRMATIQKHNDIANRRDIIKTISVAKAREREAKHVDLDTVPDLFPKLEQAVYRWGMAVDLDKCDGCGACVVACSIENNIPQVGRFEVMLGREMNWIRIDRYFSGDVNNPEVSFQPMMCQHCNHAPCEPVCPVFATTHEPEGLNAMTYNRCVGTRYCANACPYKVRRFNWYTYKWGMIGESPLHRNPRAMNPDVTVRTRGVMEKCSMCVARIREGKHVAKLDNNRLVRDGEIKTACQQTCPSDAISFGNLHDPNSEISKKRSEFRAYLVLGGDPEEGEYGLKTLPNVSYLAKITHQESAVEGHH